VRRLTVGTWELATLIRQENAAVVRTNTLAAVSGPLAALLARRSHIWHVHEDISDEHWSIRLAFRLLGMLPGQIIANSNASARALAGPIRTLRRRTRVIQPGLVETVESTSPPSVREHTELRVAFVGRLAPRKGVAELLKAVRMAHGRGIGLRLTVFGAAPPGQERLEGRYRQLAATLGIDDIVKFEGFVRDARQRLSGFDVLVVPSQRPEPFGLVIVEGMAAGCAVVACRNGGGSDEILSHGVTGLYCGRTPASIAAAIARLAGDPVFRERLGVAARNEARERFSVQRYATDIWAIDG